MKRSRSVKLVAMGTGLMLVAACEESKVDTAMFESISQCKGLGFTEQEGISNFESAKKVHINASPKYTSRTDCENDFGAKQCEVAPHRTSTGGSVFMPLMAGYMMGSVLGGGHRSQPLYRSRDDRSNFRTADNRKIGSTIGRTKVAKSATKTPSVKTRTVSRGGFGARARSTGRRSFGG